MTHPRPQSRAASVFLVTTTLLAIACQSDLTPPLSSSRAPDHLRKPVGDLILTLPCRIGYDNGGATYFDTPVPTNGTVCGIAWNLSYPAGNMTPREYTFGWRSGGFDQPGQPVQTWVNGMYGDVQNGPLEVTFSKKVANVTVYLSLMSDPGHYMLAFDSSGSRIDSAGWSGTGGGEATLDVGNIRKVLLYPVVTYTTPGGNNLVDGVTHRLSFEPDTTCPPTDNPILDHPDFKNRFDSLMKHSMVDSAVTKRREVAVYAYMNATTGEIMLDPFEWSAYNPCVVVSQANPPSGWMYFAKIHTHPYFEGENVSHCPGTPPGPYNPRANGGGGKSDWENAILWEYVLTPEWAFKLRSGTPEEDRPYNADMWKRGTNGCYTRSR